MLRILGIGSARLGAIAAAALIAGAIVPNSAEAKRGFSLGGAHSSGSPKSHTDSSRGDAGNASHKPADEAATGTPTHADGVDAADGKAAADGDSSSGSGARLGVTVRTRSTEEKEQPAAEGAAAKPATAAAAPPAADYYGKRAKSILKGEDGAINHPLHPLAAAHPGMDVVVCEGGCNEVPAEIVFMQPTTFKPKSAEQIAAEKAAKLSLVKGAKVVAASAPGTPASNDIVCLGGCYDTPRNYVAALSRDAQPVALGEWMTSVTPTSATPAKPGSGDWMRKIDSTRPADAVEQKPTK